jgi:hypothetical protein
VRGAPVDPDENLMAREAQEGHQPCDAGADDFDALMIAAQARA